MGQRVADMLAGVSVLAARPEVDASRLATVGLSLGGEAVMHIAALDTRLKVAVSSGWLVIPLENQSSTDWRSVENDEFLMKMMMRADEHCKYASHALPVLEFPGAGAGV